MMKLFVIVLLALNACTPGEPGDIIYDVQRIVQNESGYDVQIKSYYNEKNNFKVEEYSIEKGKEYTETGVFGSYGIGGGGIPTSTDMEWAGTVDSVIVTFGTLRFQKHCTEFAEGCVNNERSIILGGIEHLISAGYTQHRYDYRFIYVISEEDFNNAEPI